MAGSGGGGPRGASPYMSMGRSVMYGEGGGGNMAMGGAGGGGMEMLYGGEGGGNELPMGPGGHYPAAMYGGMGMGHPGMGGRGGRGGRTPKGDRGRGGGFLGGGKGLAGGPGRGPAKARGGGHMGVPHGYTPYQQQSSPQVAPGPGANGPAASQAPPSLATHEHDVVPPISPSGKGFEPTGRPAPAQGASSAQPPTSSTYRTSSATDSVEAVKSSGTPAADSGSK